VSSGNRHRKREVAKQQNHSSGWTIAHTALSAVPHSSAERAAS